MLRWLFSVALCFTLIGCHPPDEPATQPTTQIAEPLPPESQPSDSQPAQPQTQPVHAAPVLRPLPTTHSTAKSSTRPATDLKESRVLALTPGLSFESLEKQFEDPFISDSLFIQINCPDSNNAYYLMFNLDAKEEHLVLWSVFWLPKDAFITAPIVIWPRSKAGLTLEEADLATFPQPVSPPSTTQPTLVK